MNEEMCKKYFDNVRIWGAYNTESVMADEPVRATSPDLDLCGIKGETESGQFIMTSYNDFPVAAYSIVASDLKHKNGKDIIAGSYIEIFNQKYIKIVQPSVERNSTRTAPFRTGYYPDALIPMDKAVLKCENRLDPLSNQGIWVNVNIPENAMAGEYSGRLTISVGDYSREVAIDLQVFDLTMPQEVHDHSLFAIWYDLIEQGEQVPLTKALAEKYYWYLIGKRINTTSVPTIAYKNYDEFAEYIVQFAKDKRITKYKLPVLMEQKDGHYVANCDDAQKLLIALAKKQMQLEKSGDTDTDLFKKGFWYTIDEPDFCDKMEEVPLNEKVLVKAKKAVALLYPDIADKIKKAANIMVTQFLHPDFAGSDENGGIQTWCVQVHRFDSSARYSFGGKDDRTIEEFIQWRRGNPDAKEAGEDIWWYTCNVPENPYPNFMLDENLIATRLMSWMQYNLNVTGGLAWCVNYFQKYSDIGITGRNVWEDPCTMARINGDGYLLYPGSAYGIDGPIGTIRLESLREGKEDYEYFWLLETRLNEINNKLGKNYSARSILAKGLKQLVKNNVIPIISGGHENIIFAENRKKLLELLESIYKNDILAVEVLDRLL